MTGHAKTGALPADLDWKSLVDPSVTTAIYMPTRTLNALVTRALAEGLDPQTPAIAISRATRPDQATVSAPVAELAARLVQAAMPGPVLILFGQICSEATSRGASGANEAGFRQLTPLPGRASRSAM